MGARQELNERFAGKTIQAFVEGGGRVRIIVDGRVLDVSADMKVLDQADSVAFIAKARQLAMKQSTFAVAMLPPASTPTKLDYADSVRGRDMQKVRGDRATIVIAAGPDDAPEFLPEFSDTQFLGVGYDAVRKHRDEKLQREAAEV